MTVGDLDAAERSRVPRDHFDEPDKSCYAGYGCTDDCPVGGRGRQVPKRQFLRVDRTGMTTRYVPQSLSEEFESFKLPVARLVVPWRQRVERHYIRILCIALLAAIFLMEVWVVGALVNLAYRTL